MVATAVRRATGLLALWGPAAAWAAVIWYLSSLPAPPSPVDVPDYVSHAVEFGILGVLVWWGASGGSPGKATGRTAAAAIGLCLLYGVLDEAHQGFVPGRDPSGTDVAADAAGIVLAALAMWLLGRLVASRRRDRAGQEACRVELLSRRDCHLCDEAEEVLRSLQEEMAFKYVKVDVDADAALRERYGHEVPVLLVGGRKLCKYRIDPDRLRRKLQQNNIR